MESNGTPAPGTPDGGGAPGPGTPPPGRASRRSFSQRFQSLPKEERVKIIVAVIGGVAVIAGAVLAATVTGLFQSAAQKVAVAGSPTPTLRTDPKQPTQDSPNSTPSTPITSSPSPFESPTWSPEPPLPDYSIKADRITISLPTPDTYEPGKLDIDEIKTSRGGKLAAEFEYESTWGNLEPANDAFVGTSSSSRPNGAAACTQDAERSAIAELNYNDLSPGDAFCIVSADESVAWIRFISKGSGSRPPLKFELTVWQKS